MESPVNGTIPVGNASFSTLTPAEQLITMLAANCTPLITNILNSDNNHSCLESSIEGEIQEAPFDVVSMLVDIFTGLIYGIAFLLGTIGNSLIIYIVLNYTRMRTLCNVFLASLATADLLLVFLCIPVKLIQLMSYTWTLGMFTCKALHYVQNVSAFCSVMTLTTMSIERYYAIIHPVECRTTFSMAHIKKIIVLVWALAFIMAIPTNLVYFHLEVGDQNNVYYWCVKISPTWNTEEKVLFSNFWIQFRKVYECFQMILILIIPAIIMIYMYSRICVHLWSIMHSGGEGVRYGRVKQINNLKTSRNGQCVILAQEKCDPNKQEEIDETKANQEYLVDIPVMNSAKTGSTSSGSSESSGSSNLTMSRYRLSYQQKTIEEDNATVKQVIKMLVAVVVFFIICWTPLITINLLKGFEIISEINEGYLREILSVAYLLAYLNSVINPFVYGLMSKNFRQYFYDAIHDILGKLTPKKVKRRIKPRSSAATSATANRMRRSVPNAQFDNHFDLKDTINVRYSSPTIEDHYNRSHAKLSDNDRAFADEYGLSVIVLESENDSCQCKFTVSNSPSPLTINGSSLISVL